jgi:hypothetical protein
MTNSRTQPGPTRPHLTLAISTHTRIAPNHKFPNEPKKPNKNALSVPKTNLKRTYQPPSQAPNPTPGTPEIPIAPAVHDRPSPRIR